MTEPDPNQPTHDGIAAEQERLNQLVPPSYETTAEQRATASTPEELAAADPASPLTYKPLPQQIGGLILILATGGTAAYLALQGRIGELRAHYSFALPIAILGLTYGFTLLLPNQTVAAIFGVGTRYPKTLRGHDYAGIIEKGGDLQLIPIKGPAVYTKKPAPAIYDALAGSRVRVTKTIRAGTYLTIFNQSNPLPVNRQGIYGYTAEYLYNLIGGTSSLINGAWASALGLGTKIDKKKLLILLAAIALAYFGWQWYHQRFG